MQAVGNALFVKYFTKNPGDQAHFKKFAGVGVGDLPGNAAFNAQTLVVLEFLDKLVAGLGSNAGDLMAAQKAPHTARGVGMPEFKRMFDFIPGFMAENGGDADAWKAACGALEAALK